MGINSKEMEYAAVTDLGGKLEQQDDYLTCPNFINLDGTMVQLYAIFDGHGGDGKKASNEARIEFPKVLMTLQDLIKSNPAEALKKSFEIVNTKMIQNETIDTYLSGTTAVVMLLIGNIMHVAHVGDSRLAILSIGDGKLNGKIITNDHTCANIEERKRVESKGARVDQLDNGGQPEGPLRIFKGSLPYPGIIVSRSLGDEAAQSIGVLWEPEITQFTLTESHKYLVLGTDGLWDGLSIDQVAKVFNKNPLQTTDELANLLLRYALAGLNKNYIDDNITIVLCRLK